jgi:polar amino acid transport system permease protein
MATGVPTRGQVGAGGFDPARGITEVVPLRHYGRWVVALVLLVLCVALVRAVSAGDIEWSVVGDYLTAKAILQGLLRTVFISVLSLLVGTVLGVVFAVMRLSKNPVTKAVAWFYVWFFRGTPVYLQLLLWFNIALIFPNLSFLGLYEARTVDVMTPFLAALLGLSINEGAYMTEIVRGGILSVEQGQADAAAALGMTPGLTMRRIVLPQSMRVIIPPVGNEFIGLLKTSSLASTIMYAELLFQAERIYQYNTRIMELLFVATFWYLVAVSFFSIGQYYLERRFARGSVRELPETPLQRLRRNLDPRRTRPVKPGTEPEGSAR